MSNSSPHPNPTTQILADSSSVGVAVPNSTGTTTTPVPVSIRSPFELCLPLQGLSPSRASEYKRCPQQFKLSSIDRIPEPITLAQARGTAVHLALEYFYADFEPHQRDLATLVSLFLQAWETLCEEDEQYRHLFKSPAEEKEFRKETVQILSDYFLLEDPQEVQPVALELRVNLPSRTASNQKEDISPWYEWRKEILKTTLAAWTSWERPSDHSEFMLRVGQLRDQTADLPWIDMVWFPDPDSSEHSIWEQALLGIFFIKHWNGVHDHKPTNDIDSEVERRLVAGGLRLLRFYAAPKQNQELQIRGIIDRMELSEEGNLILTDYKTGAAPEERYSGSRFFALKIYSWLIQQMAENNDLIERWGVDPDLTPIINQGKVEALRLLYLNGPDEDRMPLGKRDNIGRQLQALWNAINTARVGFDLRLLELESQTMLESEQDRALTEASLQFFPANKGPLCEYCYYRTHHCPVWQPPYHQPEQSEAALVEEASSSDLSDEEK